MIALTSPLVQRPAPRRRPGRRIHPRVPVQAFCSQHDDLRERPALVVDMSVDGLRIQRPAGGWKDRQMRLEFEVPGVDEVVWALGEIRFDEIWQVPPDPDGGLSGILRTSGVRIVRAAERHRRMVREFVTEAWRAMGGTDLREPIDDASPVWPDAHDAHEPPSWLLHAACYLRG